MYVMWLLGGLNEIKGLGLQMAVQDPRPDSSACDAMLSANTSELLWLPGSVAGPRGPQTEEDHGPRGAHILVRGGRRQTINYIKTNRL